MKSKNTNQLKKLQAAYKMAQLERELSSVHENTTDQASCLYCWTPVHSDTCDKCGNEVTDLANDPFLSMNDYVQTQIKHIQAV